MSLPPFQPDFNVLLHRWICFWTCPLALQISLPARGWQSACLCIYLPGARKWPSELLLFVGSAVCTGSVSLLFHVLLLASSSDCFDFVLILFWHILSLQGGGCCQPPFITTGLWGEKVLGFRENYLWGTELCRILHFHRFIWMLHCLYIHIQCCCQKWFILCVMFWLSGSGVLWGALQSGLERYSVSSESSGHQYPFDQLSDHRKVSPPPW